jgi:hypothetical protein
VNVFITGGCGFIGSHLAERLLERGDAVMVLDDLSTGSMDNIAHLIGRPGFQHRIGSSLDRPLVSELVDRADVTVHLAAAVGVRLIVEQPVHTIETNVGATETVLAAAAKKQKLVVVASTSEDFGGRRSSHSARITTCSSGPRRIHAGRMPARKRSMNGWPWLMRARGTFRSSSPDSSIPWARVKRAATGWSFPASLVRHCVGNRSPYTARAISRAVLATCGTRSRASCA